MKTPMDFLDEQFKKDCGQSFDDFFRDTTPENIKQDSEIFKFTILEAIINARRDMLDQCKTLVFSNLPKASI